MIEQCISLQGNEYVTYSSPDGERHTMNGVEQHHGRINAPRRSNTTPTSRQPPPAIADRPTEPPVNVVPPAQPFNVPISGMFSPGSLARHLMCNTRTHVHTFQAPVILAKPTPMSLHSQLRQAPMSVVPPATVTASAP